MKNLIHNIFGKALIVLMVFVFLFTTACTSYKVMAPTKTVTLAGLKENDVVTVFTKGASEPYTLSILEITDKTLIGTNQQNGSRTFLPFAAIRKLEKDGVDRAALYGSLKNGDYIRVTTKSGNVYELVNLEITDKTLIGKNFRNGHKIVLPFEVIQRLEKRKISAGNTIAAVVLGTLGVLLVAALIIGPPDVGVGGEGLCFYDCPAISY